MTVRLWRWLIFATVGVPFIGLVAAAQPLPQPQPLAPDRKSGGDDTSLERAKLQAEFLMLLRRLSVSTPTGPTNPPLPPPQNPNKIIPSTGSRSIDPIREGTNYFRDNDFEGARRTFLLIDPNTLGREDRAYVRYMLACSLRRQNRVADAEVVYREVANSQDDEFLTSCAVWQLSLIKSDQELQAQLEQLRSRAKSK